MTIDKAMLAAATVAALAAALPARAQQDDVKQKLLGTWKLISVVREEVPSGAKTDQLGPSPSGYITYGPDNRMMVVIVGSNRKKPAGNVATPAEAEALFRSVTAYAGRYEIADGKLTHHIDVSWNELWTGTSQARFFKFEGDRVVLSTAVSPDPVDGKTSVRRITWQKVQ